MRKLYGGVRRFGTRSAGVWTGVAFLAAGLVARADQVEMQNGDRYVGKVMSLSSNLLVLQSDILGTVKLARAKVAVISLGANLVTNASTDLSWTGKPKAAAVAATNANTDLQSAFRQLGTGTNLIQQVQKQFLSDAGPEANAKFNELMTGIMDGKVTMTDLRAQAKTAADQVRSLKGEMGDQTGLLDGYLSILDQFLKETGTATGATPAGAEKASGQSAKTPEE